MLVFGAVANAQAAGWQVCWGSVGATVCAAQPVPLGPLATVGLSLAIAIAALLVLRYRTRGATFLLAGALVIALAAAFNVSDAWAPVAQQIDIDAPTGMRTLACSSTDPIVVANDNASASVQLAITPFAGADPAWAVTGLAACTSGTLLAAGAQCGLPCAPPPQTATIAVAGSPLSLTTNGAAGTLTLTNTSASVTASNIASNFTGTALDGNVTETGNSCASVAPASSCTLTLTPGATAVAQTAFPIQGSNTNTVLAQVTINALVIGEAWEGGVIYALDPSGTSGSVAATADNSTGIEWGGLGTITNASSNTDGAANTATIVATLGAGSYAANFCAEYEVDSAGNSPCQVGNACYNDWSLPARNELDALYQQSAAVGGFAAGFYWSSTESSVAPATNAWLESFASGTQVMANKNLTERVRCVRHFAS